MTRTKTRVIWFTQSLGTHPAGAFLRLAQLWQGFAELGCWPGRRVGVLSFGGESNDFGVGGAVLVKIALLGRESGNFLKLVNSKSTYPFRKRLTQISKSLVNTVGSGGGGDRWWCSAPSS